MPCISVYEMIGRASAVISHELTHLTMHLIFTECIYFNGKFSSSDGKQKCSVGNVTKSAGYFMGLRKEWPPLFRNIHPSLN